MKRKIVLLCSGWASNYLTDFINGARKATKNIDVDFYCFTAYDYTELSGFPNYTGYSIFNLINYDDYDGVIIFSDLISNARVLEKERLKILKSGKPAISINKKLEGITNIRVDNYSAAYEVMTHLIKDHGVTDFGYIGGKENALDFAERYKAYRTAHLDNNLKINMENVITIDRSEYIEAYDFLSDYLKNGNKLPECIVCANDLIAFAVLKIAEENNIKIPEQLKVVGYDDNIYSKSTTPSVTTVKSNAELIGAESVKRLLSGNNEVQQLKLQSTPVYRHSCGCEEKSMEHQKIFSLNMISEQIETETFARQMEKIQEIFTEATDVFTLLTNLELFIAKSHNWEGDNFAIFLKSDWSSVLINSQENLPQNYSYGAQVQAISSIVNNKKYPREIIATSSLVSSKMKEGNNNLFIFYPIFNHSYVHGYLVTKNNTNLFRKRFAYQWTKTFGTSIERFRKQNMFKQMSQQFLRLSTRDALSGMLNRVGMDKLAKHFYAQNKKNGLTTVLFFVDINSMKTINDKFGHLHGDLAVKTIAASVMDVVPRNWLCIRYGGDEFLVVGNSKNYNGEDYCSIIQQNLAKKTATMKLPYTLSASVGTYSVPPSSSLTLEEAVEKVDEIMYEKKQAFHKQQ